MELEELVAPTVCNVVHYIVKPDGHFFSFLQECHDKFVLLLYLELVNLHINSDLH